MPRLDLSRLSIARRLRALHQDAGSSLVTVLIIMLVLTVGGVAIAGIAMGTAVTVVDSKNRTSAQAVVDGAMASLTVDLLDGTLPCDATAPTSGSAKNGTATDSPVYDWQLVCTVAGTVGTATLSAESTVNGESAVREAVFSYEVEPPTPGFGDLNFYGNAVVTFTAAVNPGTPSNPITLVLPNADFVCQGEVWGSIIAKGDITIAGRGCQVHGDLISVEGVVKGNQADARIYGDIKTGGTGTNVVYGRVDGNVHTRGPIDFSWSSRTISGSVVAGGNVALRDSKILGSLTMPASSTFTKSSGSYGTLTKLATVPEPVFPNLPPWFEFQYKPSEWAGFTNVITLDPALPSSNKRSCAYYSAYPHYTLAPNNGWTDLNTITADTVLDGRACTGLSTNFGMSPAVKLPHDVLILAKKLDTTSSTWTAAAGLSEKPSVWFVTEDPNPADNKPTCNLRNPSPLGHLVLNHVGTSTSLKAMAYTPCTIQVAGNSTFNGQIYGQGWNHGGGLNFVPDEILLPGMATAGGGTNTGGGTPKLTTFELQSSRDVVGE